MVGPLWGKKGIHYRMSHVGSDKITVRWETSAEKCHIKNITHTSCPRQSSKIDNNASVFTTAVKVRQHFLFCAILRQATTMTNSTGDLPFKFTMLCTPLFRFFRKVFYGPIRLAGNMRSGPVTRHPYHKKTLPAGSRVISQSNSRIQELLTADILDKNENKE